MLGYFFEMSKFCACPNKKYHATLLVPTNVYFDYFKRSVKFFCKMPFLSQKSNSNFIVENLKHDEIQQASDKQSEESHSTTYLMVDSTEASEVVVCLSALTYWPGTDIKYFSSLKQDQTSPGESNSDG